MECLFQDEGSGEADYSRGLAAFNELRKWADMAAEEYAILHAKRDALEGHPALGLRSVPFIMHPLAAISHGQATSFQEQALHAYNLRKTSFMNLHRVHWLLLSSFSVVHSRQYLALRIAFLAQGPSEGLEIRGKAATSEVCRL